jgi:hypothetical protein
MRIKINNLHRTQPLTQSGHASRASGRHRTRNPGEDTRAVTGVEGMPQVKRQEPKVANLGNKGTSGKRGNRDKAQTL